MPRVFRCAEWKEQAKIALESVRSALAHLLIQFQIGRDHLSWSFRLPDLYLPYDACCNGPAQELQFCLCKGEPRHEK
jgi:hypothetical protein